MSFDTRSFEPKKKIKVKEMTLIVIVFREINKTRFSVMFLFYG